MEISVTLSTIRTRTAIVPSGVYDPEDVLIAYANF